MQNPENPGDRDHDLKISKKLRENQKKIPGVRDFLLSGYPGDEKLIGIFLRGMGYPDKKPTLLIRALYLPKFITPEKPLFLAKMVQTNQRTK